MPVPTLTPDGARLVEDLESVSRPAALIAWTRLVEIADRIRSAEVPHADQVANLIDPRVRVTETAVRYFAAEITESEARLLDGNR